MDRGYSKYINDEYVMFKHAKGVGATREKEFHEYHEIVLFLGGQLEFYSEKMRAKLLPEQIIIIPKESYHQFIISGNEDDYHRCIFSFYDCPELAPVIEKGIREVSVIDMNPKLKFLFGKVIEAAEKDFPQNEKKLLMRSVLALLISELALVSTHTSRIENTDSLSSRCIDYINSHICDPLTVAEIAKELNVSASTLTHSFKKNMNISVYRYILQKKLILAQQRLSKGESVTATALECGFNDYSGFYKQYKKMFGTSPSEKNSYF